MKKTGLVASLAIAALLLSSRAHSQSTTDYFPGKWKVTVYGTPNGDAAMIFQLERKDGKLTGTVRDSTDKEMAKITKVDETDSSVNMFFTTQGYDVNVFLKPVPADSVKGNLMDMFDAKGIRLKDKK
jgi:hypothetical protein